MPIIIDPEYHKLKKLIEPYREFDLEKFEWVYKEGTPEEIFQAVKRMEEIYEENLNWI